MSHAKKVMLSIFLTTRCNLDCIYCYANKGRAIHDHQTISFEFVKVGIDFYINEFNNHHLRFFGAGEPTCELDLMKKICEYARIKTNSELITEIQTNGAFGPSARDWLAENINIIWVSSDGPPDIQDYYRPFFKSGEATSSIIESNIKYLLRNGKGFTGIRVTINDLNIERQIEMVDYFSSMGITYIWTDPLFPPVGYRPIINNPGNNPKITEIDLLKYVKLYSEAYHYAKKKNIFYGSFLACNFDEKTSINCRACIPVPHLTTDGYISACDMALFGENANHMDVFIYGKWDKQNNSILIDKNKIDSLRSRSLSNLPGCNNCLAAKNCAGYCLGEVVNETGSLYGQKKDTCDAIRLLANLIQMNEGCYPHLHP
jgi:uncharacterized protein